MSTLALSTDPPYGAGAPSSPAWGRQTMIGQPPPPSGWGAGLGLACGLVASSALCAASRAPGPGSAACMILLALLALAVGAAAIAVEGGHLHLAAWRTAHSHRGWSVGFAVRRCGRVPDAMHLSWTQARGLEERALSWRPCPAFRGPGLRVAFGSAEGIASVKRLAPWRATFM